MKTKQNKTNKQQQMECDELMLHNEERFAQKPSQPVTQLPEFTCLLLSHALAPTHTLSLLFKQTMHRTNEECIQE
jgi:hypothetical protein